MYAYRSGIYEIVNAANGKRYVGSAASLRDRWHGHRYRLRRGDHHSIALQRAWQKYGEGSFSFRPLVFVSRADLIFFEQRAIDTLAPEYNVAPTAGSSLGRQTAESTKEKLRAAITGKKRSDETRARMRESRAGRAPVRFSAEARARMSEARRGRKMPPRCAAHTQKIAAARRLLSDEQVRQIRVSVAGGQTRTAMAAMHGCSIATVSHIVARKRGYAGIE